MLVFFFFSSRRRHTRLQGDWSSDVCSSDLRADLARLEIARREVIEDVIAEDDGLAEHGVRRVPVLHVRLYRVHEGVVLRLRRHGGRHRDDEYQEREDGEASTAHGVLHQGANRGSIGPESGAHDAAKARRVSNATIAACRVQISCTGPTGGRPVGVSADARSSRPRSWCESATAERGVKSLYGGSEGAGRNIT